MIIVIEVGFFSYLRLGGAVSSISIFIYFHFQLYIYSISILPIYLYNIYKLLFLRTF